MIETYPKSFYSSSSAKQIERIGRVRLDKVHDDGDEYRRVFGIVGLEQVVVDFDAERQVAERCRNRVGQKDDDERDHD